MRNRSTLRVLAEAALNQQDRTLEEFLTVGQANGKSIRVLADELGRDTGIPISYRTLYRWAEDLETVAS